MYGSDGYLYAKHKVNGEIFVLVNGEWDDLDSVQGLMQGVNENSLDSDVDNLEFFPDDF